MNKQIILEFVSLSEEDAKLKLQTYSNDEIADIAEAYFTGRDGCYDCSYTYDSYKGAEGVRRKLQSVAIDTLQGIIIRYLGM